ncbi:MAG: hypothetical protein JXA54_09490 [Candidatus Heimdallarchaeota archaeon]|nr:hypothetical protein [Candidatus Heimdallarchaeota archaeon]
MSNDEDLDYEKEEEPRYKNSGKLSDRSRKILSYTIVAIVTFSFGCGIIGFSMLANENSPRKELASTNKYLSSIISSFNVRVYNSSTIDELTDYVYIYNSSDSTFEDSGGQVYYIDDKENLEYMKISFSPEASENLIQIITFHVEEKSQLNIIIFADNREVYSALKIKNDIELNFSLVLPSEIIVYVF